MTAFSKNDFWRTLGITILLTIFLTASVSFYYPVVTSLAIVITGFGWAFFPGFFVTLIFFPFKKNLIDPVKERDPSLDILERLLLSVFLSLTLSVLIFMVLQKTPIALTLSVFAITTISANILTGAVAAIVLSRRREPSKNNG